MCTVDHLVLHLNSTDTMMARDLAVKDCVLRQHATELDSMSDCYICYTSCMVAQS